ncbi:MAG: PEP-CTERM sorting domain-containing protein [bacterium]|nr:PEP-CTERM sorting domain-containing protein [bacterium]
MKIRCAGWALAALVSLSLSAPEALAGTLTLRFFGGSSLDRILDDGGVELPAGNAAYIYGNSGPLDVNSIITMNPGSGFSVAPAGIVRSLAIGDGISPPTDTDGRFLFEVNLGSFESPNFADGLSFFVFAFNASDPAIATAYGVSPSSYTVDNSILPLDGDLTPLPVDFVFNGFATTTTPEPATGVLLLAALAGLAAARHRN